MFTSKNLPSVAFHLYFDPALPLNTGSPIGMLQAINLIPAVIPLSNRIIVTVRQASVLISTANISSIGIFLLSWVAGRQIAGIQDISGKQIQFSQKQFGEMNGP